MDDVLRMLPEGTASAVAEYLGPCPVALEARRKTIQLFKTGLLGAPYWTVTMLDGVSFQYIFVTPCHELFEYKRVRGIPYPRDYAEDFARNTCKYIHDEPYLKYLSYMDRAAVVQCTRNRIFLRAGISLYVGSEGPRQHGYPLTWDAAHNIDVLWIWKYTHGDTLDEVLTSARKRLDHHRACLDRGNSDYHARVLKALEDTSRIL